MVDLLDPGGPYKAPSPVDLFGRRTGLEEPATPKGSDLEVALLWGIIPGHGGYLPCPAGATVIDFQKEQISFDGGLAPIPTGVPGDILRNTRSVVIIADSLVYVTISPGYGTGPTAGALIEGSARNIKTVTLESDAPYNVLFVVGTGEEAPRIRFDQLFQLRYSDTTLTKVEAAATPDDLSNIAFVPVSRDRNGTTITLTQATFGVAWIRAPGWGKRTYVIRNVGPGAAEVQLFGSGSKAAADALGWVEDTDTGSDAGRITIASGDNLILETSLAWNLMQLRAAVAAAEDTDVEARLVIEYAGLSGSAR